MQTNESAHRVSELDWGVTLLQLWGGRCEWVRWSGGVLDEGGPPDAILRGRWQQSEVSRCTGRAQFEPSSRLSVREGSKRRAVSSLGALPGGGGREKAERAALRVTLRAISLTLRRAAGPRREQP
jgi:hypothetical protein